MRRLLFQDPQEILVAETNQRLGRLRKKLLVVVYVLCYLISLYSYFRGNYVI